MGHIHIIRGFPSPPEQASRTLRIYTPDGYERGDDRFGVLYMQDGQNVFAHAESAQLDTWCANWAIEKTVAEGRTAPWIIVAVDHDVDRFAQYSPWEEPRADVWAAKGSLYLEFLTEHLKPYIDRTYRTRSESEHTGIMGASLGGLIALYAGWRRPDVFGRLGGISPSVMWSLGHLFDAWSSHTRQWSRIYLDVGDKERFWRERVPMFYDEAVPAFYDRLRRLGYADYEVRLVVEPGGQHHERDWQRRLPEAFAWLLS